MFTPRNIAERVIIGCLANDTTQSAMAKKFGIAVQQLSHVLSGKIKHSSYFDRIAQELHCSVEWLITGTDPQPTWMSSGVSNNHPSSPPPDLAHLSTKLDQIIHLLTTRPCAAATQPAAPTAAPTVPFRLQVPKPKSKVHAKP